VPEPGGGPGGGGDGGGGEGGKPKIAGGARIEATSGRWVSFRTLPDAEDDPD